MATEDDPESAEKERLRKHTVEKLSDFSDKLMALGHHGKKRGAVVGGALHTRGTERKVCDGPSFF